MALALRPLAREHPGRAALVVYAILSKETYALGTGLCARGCVCTLYVYSCSYLTFVPYRLFGDSL